MLALLHPLPQHLIFLISLPDRCWGSIILIVKYYEGVTINAFAQDHYNLALRP